MRHQKAKDSQVECPDTKNTISRINSWNKDMVSTSALEKAMEKIEAGHTWITIKGSPGEGKTTVAFMALEKLHIKKRRVFYITSPSEFATVISGSRQPVIMLDDIFGYSEFDESLWSKWQTCIHQVLSMKEHNLQGSKETVLEEAIILMVGRDYILNSVLDDLGKLADFLTKEEFVVNMTHKEERTVNEKLSILKALSKTERLNLPVQTVKDIVEAKFPHGFPNICQLYLRNYSQDIDPIAMFSFPLEFLNHTIRKFMQDDKKVSLFKDMITRKGRISVEELTQPIDSTRYVLAVRLVGTYLKKENNYFLFSHDSIHDCLAFSLYTLAPLDVIHSCRLTFISARVRLLPADIAEVNDVNIMTNAVLYLPATQRQILVERFALEISENNLINVLSHTAFADEIFVKECMSCLNLPVTTVLKLTDEKTGEEFLSVMAASDSPQLLMYIDNNTEMTLNKVEVNAYFYGICKYGAVKALGYLEDTRQEMLDINATSGIHQQTPLMLAAETKDIDFVCHLLTYIPDLGLRDEFGNTALHYICKSDLHAAAKQIINKDIDVNARNIEESTPLHSASAAGSHEWVDVLLKARVNVNAKNSDGCTALHKAAEVGSHKCVNLLVRAEADINAKTKNDLHTPLHYAALSGSVKTIDILLIHKENIDAPNAQLCTPLHFAVRGGSKEVVETLLKSGASVCSEDKEGNRPLHYAAQSNTKETVTLLVSRGARVNVQNKNGYTPLHCAAGLGSKETADALIVEGANSHTTCNLGLTPIHCAAIRGSKEMTDFLISVGGNVNARSKDHSTPLHFAAGKGDKGTVSVLLKAKNMKATETKDCHAKEGNVSPMESDVNVDTPNAYGYTSLHFAAKSGSKETVELLLKAGAKVNAKDIDDYTPLHYAVENSYLESVELLIKAHAKVNVKNNKHCTPLHFAADKGFIEIVCVLLNHGARVNLENSNGNTPYDIALEKEFLDIVHILLKFGANKTRSLLGKIPDDETILHQNEKQTDNTSTGHTPTCIGKQEKKMTRPVRSIDPPVTQKNKIDGTSSNHGTESKMNKNAPKTRLHRTGRQEHKSSSSGKQIDSAVPQKKKPSYGDTSLHVAVRNKDKTLINILLQAQNDVHTRNDLGKTPMQIAKESNDYDIVDILQANSMYK